jgi:hypothetical protein
MEWDIWILSMDNSEFPELLNGFRLGRGKSTWAAKGNNISIRVVQAISFLMVNLLYKRTTTG